MALTNSRDLYSKIGTGLSHIGSCSCLPLDSGRGFDIKLKEYLLSISFCIIM